MTEILAKIPVLSPGGIKCENNLEWYPIFYEKVLSEERLQSKAHLIQTKFTCSFPGSWMAPLVVAAVVVVVCIFLSFSKANDDNDAACLLLTIHGDSGELNDDAVCCLLLLLCRRRGGKFSPTAACGSCCRDVRHSSEFNLAFFLLGNVGNSSSTSTSQ